MPRQLRSSKTSSRGRRQATSTRPYTRRQAPSTRPYTRSTQRDIPVTADNNSPGKDTRSLTTDDIASIVQQVAATLSSESHLPPPPAATSPTTATTVSDMSSSAVASTNKTTESNSSGPEETSSTSSPGILTQGDISSLVDAVVSRLSGSQASNSSSTTARAGNHIVSLHARAVSYSFYVLNAITIHNSTTP